MALKQKKQLIKVGTHSIPITHADKILFPKTKFTKGDLVAYYAAVAQVMFPLVKNRLIMMQRFPEGINHEWFYQKDAPDYFPDWIARKNVPRQDGAIVQYTVANNRAVIPFIANQGCITPHCWLSKADKVHYPDKMIFDLDPGKAPFGLVQKTAFLLKNLLEELGLVPFIMTTGSHGMHVVVPIKRTQKFEFVREYAHTISKILVQQYPTMLTLEMRKEKRGKKIFMDYLRNGFGATSVAPYAIRSHEGAPVATPIDWDEAAEKKLTSQRYTLETVFKRLAKKGDPWKDFAKKSRTLKKLD